jgi:hypothetical protein
MFWSKKFSSSCTSSYFQLQHTVLYNWKTEFANEVGRNAIELLLTLPNFNEVVFKVIFYIRAQYVRLLRKSLEKPPSHWNLSTESIDP